MNTYYRATCIIGLALAGFLCGWFANGIRLNKKIDQIHKEYAEEQAKAEEQIRQKELMYRNEMSAQAERYQTAVISYDNDINKLKTEMKRVQKNNPIDCSIGADRLSIIKQASQRANSRNSAAR